MRSRRADQRLGRNPARRIGRADSPASRAAVAVPPAVEGPDDLPPEQWPALYEAGATLQEIAERTGHTSKRVRRELWARGVKFRPRCPRPPAWHATAAEMWARGATYAEISKVVGQTRSAVRVALLRRKQRLAQAAMSGPIDPSLTQSVPPKNELDG